MIFSLYYYITGFVFVNSINDVGIKEGPSRCGPGPWRTGGGGFAPVLGEILYDQYLDSMMTGASVPVGRTYVPDDPVIVNCMVYDPSLAVLVESQ